MNIEQWELDVEKNSYIKKFDKSTIPNNRFWRKEKKRWIETQFQSMFFPRYNVHHIPPEDIVFPYIRFSGFLESKFKAWIRRRKALWKLHWRCDKGCREADKTYIKNNFKGNWMLN